MNTAIDYLRAILDDSASAHIPAAREAKAFVESLETAHEIEATYDAIEMLAKKHSAGPDGKLFADIAESRADAARIAQRDRVEPDVSMVFFANISYAEDFAKDPASVSVLGAMKALLATVPQEEEPRAHAVVNSFTLGGKVFALLAGDSEGLPAVNAVFQVRGESASWLVVAYADIQADSGDAGRWAEVRLASGMPTRTVARGEIAK